MSYETEILSRVTLFHRDNEGESHKPCFTGYVELPNGEKHDISLWRETSNSSKVLNGEYFKGRVSREVSK